MIDSPPDVGTQLIILLAIVEKIDNSKKNIENIVRQIAVFSLSNKPGGEGLLREPPPLPAVLGDGDCCNCLF